MKTDELIAQLAADAGVVDPNAAARRWTGALGWGALGALLLLAAGYGVRPDLHEAMRLPMFWVKLAFPATLLAIAVPMALRLARPGMRLRRLPVTLLVPLAAVWLLAAVELATATPTGRSALIFGSSWRQCPFNIALLSIPAFVATFAAMRRLAPTRLAAAGAAAGLAAGALGATVYALHCTEMAASFVGLWYVAGMLIPTTAGALLGPRLLRW